VCTVIVSGFLCRRPDDVELTTKTSAWFCSRRPCFWIITTDIFFINVCHALGAFVALMCCTNLHFWIFLSYLLTFASLSAVTGLSCSDMTTQRLGEILACCSPRRETPSREHAACDHQTVLDLACSDAHLSAAGAYFLPFADATARSPRTHSTMVRVRESEEFTFYEFQNFTNYS